MGRKTARSDKSAKSQKPAPEREEAKTPRMDPADSNRSDAEQPAAEKAAADKPRRTLPLWKKVVFSVVPVVLALAMLEGGLWVFGYESPVADPYESFVFRAPLFIESGDKMTTDYTRRLFFHTQEFARQKPPGTKRVFVFGGSTTFGHMLPDPWNDSYVHQLGVLLERDLPSVKIEMINCGGKSYASYRLVDLVEECMQYQPDLVIVMSGHNEFIEARHYKDLIGADTASNRFWYSLRTVRLLHDLGSRVEEQKPFLGENPYETERYIVRDEREFQLTLEHYTRNLNRMVDACRAHDVPIVLCTCPSNLLDQKPFVTEPPPGMDKAEFRQVVAQAAQHLEAGEYEQALAIVNGLLEKSPRLAICNYIAGRCYYGMQQYPEAKRSLLLAKDSDAFPKRALSSFNERVREIAQERGAPLFDALPPFDDASEHGIPGKNLFLDDCHPTVGGHRLFAEGLEPIVAPLLGAPPKDGAPRESPTSDTG